MDRPGYGRLVAIEYQISFHGVRCLELLRLIDVCDELPRDLRGLLARTHQTVHEGRGSRLLNDKGGQRVARQETPLRIASLAFLQLRAPYPIFRTGLACVCDGAQRQPRIHVRRLLFLR
jgi:hypothetical protein